MNSVAEIRDYYERLQGLGPDELVAITVGTLSRVLQTLFDAIDEEPPRVRTLGGIRELKGRDLA